MMTCTIDCAVNNVGIADARGNAWHRAVVFQPVGRYHMRPLSASLVHFITTSMLQGYFLAVICWQLMSSCQLGFAFTSHQYFALKFNES